MTKRICLSALLLCPFSLRAQSANPQQLFEQAVRAGQRGDDATAVRLYRELLQAHPGATVVHANLGATLAHQKRFSEAIEQYLAALAADPHNLPVRLNLALAYQAKGDLPHAVRQLEFVHKNQPDHPQAALLLADCYFRERRYADTIAVLRPIEAALPDDPDLGWLLGSALIHSGQQKEGLPRIDQVARVTHSADAYLLAGQTRLALTDYDAARRDVDAALRVNPALAGAITLNGMLLEQTGDYAGAEAALRQALGVNFEDFDAHFYLGAVLYYRREMKGARTELEKALELRPGSAEARYELALVLRAEGDLRGALANLETVARQSPGWLQPHIELAALYFKLHRAEDGARERQIVDRLSAGNEGPAPGRLP